MLLVSPSTANALAPHAAGHGFVMFVQVIPPNGGLGPILIEAVAGAEIGQRLGALARDNAYETMLIGLVQSPSPREHADQIAEQCEAEHLHDRWYAPGGNLIAFVQHVAQNAVRELLAQTHPAAVDDRLVGIDEMAQILGVSVPTVRRLVARGEIPCLRTSGRVLRFSPREVIATMQRR